MQNLSKLFVVEFSLNQQAFHKHTVSEMIKTNITSIFLRGEADYLPIGIFNTPDEADLFIKEVYYKFKKGETELQQDAAVETIKKLI